MNTEKVPDVVIADTKSYKSPDKKFTVHCAPAEKSGATLEFPHTFLPATKLHQDANSHARISFRSASLRKSTYRFDQSKQPS
jgi:hypothetical protein